MPEIKSPSDCLGGELHKGDLVSVFPNMQLIGRIAEIHLGGVATPQGVTPQVVKVVIVLDIQNSPGGRIAALVRVISPGQEKILNKILES